MVYTLDYASYIILQCVYGVCVCVVWWEEKSLLVWKTRHLGGLPASCGCKRLLTLGGTTIHYVCGGTILVEQAMLRNIFQQS